MQLGVSTFAFGWAVGVPGFPVEKPFDERDLMAFARRFGVGTIQIGDHVPLHEYDASRLAAFREAAGGSQPLEVEIGARGLTESHLSRYIDIARTLHAPLLRFVIDARHHEPAPEDVVALVRAALPLLRGAGVTLGIENHDRFPARTLRRMMEHVGSEQVGICLDTANSLGAGEGINEVLEQLAEHTVNLHVKDFAIARVSYAMGFVVEGRPAGRGCLDLPRLLDTIAVRARRCRSATLETWVPPETELTATIEKERRWAEESILHLKQIFLA